MTKAELINELSYLQLENQKLKEIIIKLQLSEVDKRKSDDILFCDFYKNWLEQHKNNVQPLTYQKYLYIMESHIYPYFSNLNISLQDITSNDIERYYTNRILNGLSPNSVIKHHANLFTAFKFATKHQLIAKNPMLDVKRPRPTKFMANFYNIDQLAVLIKLSKSSKIYTPILLAIFLGLRRSEIIALKWDNVDFYQNTITVKYKAYKYKNAKEDSISNNLKTSSSYRILCMPNILSEYLKETYERHKTVVDANPHVYKYKDYVCVDENGERIRLDTITDCFRNLIKSNDLQHLRFHDLRHSHATMLMNLGYSLKHIQDCLGHSNISTTGNLYLHTSLKDKIEMASKINSSLNIIL